MQGKSMKYLEILDLKFLIKDELTLACFYYTYMFHKLNMFDLWDC